MNIWEKEIHVYFILSRFAEDEGAGWGGEEVWSWRRVAGRHGDSPSKGSSTSQPMKFNVAFPPGNAGKFPRKFPRNAPPFDEISIPIILSRGIIASFSPPPPSFQKNQLTSEGCKEGRCRRRKFVVSFFSSIRIFVSAFRRSYR